MEDDRSHGIFDSFTMICCTDLSPVQIHFRKKKSSMEVRVLFQFSVEVSNDRDPISTIYSILLQVLEVKGESDRRMFRRPKFQG